MSSIFLSYSSMDKPFVEKLAEDLKRGGVDVWFDLFEMKIGDSLIAKIKAGINQSDYIGVILSPRSVNSTWVREELNMAIAQEIASQSIKVLPILIENCEIPTFLRDKLFADFTSSYDAGLASLLNVLVPKKDKSAISAPVVGERLSEAAQERFDELTQMMRVLLERLEIGIQIPEDKSIFAKINEPEDRKLCFILMPFSGDDLQFVYNDFVKPTIERKFDLVCKRADDIFGTNVIMDDVWRGIMQARIIIAELTGRNANVFYEIGLCHAVGKKVLFLAQSMNDVPFDIGHRRVLLYEYSPHGCKKLEDLLVENISAMLNETGG
jgi:hypothetical protein